MLIEGYSWREIGPFRGGRVAAVTGVRRAAARLLLRRDGRRRLEDHRRRRRAGSRSPTASSKTGSIGAVAVSRVRPERGLRRHGREPLRGNVSHGDGVYKSTDAGKTWKHVGPAATRARSARIRVHPRNPDLVYVAALGPPLRAEPGARRLPLEGRRQDLGAGALRQRQRRAPSTSRWTRRTRASSTPPSGRCSARRTASRAAAPGSGLCKSTDGGDTWKKLDAQAACRRASWARIGVDGLAARTRARLGDRRGRGGRRLPLATTAATHLERSQRRARPAPARLVLHAHLRRPAERRHGLRAQRRSFTKSNDGGKTLQPDPRRRTATTTTCGSSPNDPRRMIEGNDGGANVTNDGGRTLVDASTTSRPRSSTASITDNRFPYRVYGAQQDNSHGRDREPQRRARHRRARLVRGRRAARAATSRRSPATRTSSTPARYGGYIDALATTAPARSRNVNAVARQPDGLRRRGHEVPLPVELPDRLLAARPEHALRRRRNVLFRTTDEGAELGGDQRPT